MTINNQKMRRKEYTRPDEMQQEVEWIAIPSTEANRDAQEPGCAQNMRRRAGSSLTATVSIRNNVDGPSILTNFSTITTTRQPQAMWQAQADDAASVARASRGAPLHLLPKRVCAQNALAGLVANRPECRTMSSTLVSGTA
ncbi:hypothetical protein KMZ93_04125 [Bradyrhizobium sediminis]|uniref:Uncharacterized protein n=1 Tax=Bradyrhizobium sediminis TaxID=2840469 RepID=A0A975NZ58_9BRAD|nr:hypothetical protein [Bradyrhizobium sediminis]QWG24122.1 hypothetical protein KMZ93_04125 [Bradyrhizobium sediminis]